MSESIYYGGRVLLLLREQRRCLSRRDLAEPGPYDVTLQLGDDGMTRALIYSLSVCAVSVALEGVFAGSGIRQRLAKIRVPRYAPPLWGWIVIGAFYYVICFVVLYRLFSMAQPAPLRAWALALLGGMMFINALWNYFFFRRRNLFHAYVIGLPYSLIALVLFAVLLKLERFAALCLSPYLLYLFYASLFGYRVWRLNANSAELVSARRS
jgi:tryptophan-rich sensory protein